MAKMPSSTCPGLQARHEEERDARTAGPMDRRGETSDPGGCRLCFFRSGRHEKRGVETYSHHYWILAHLEAAMRITIASV